MINCNLNYISLWNYDYNHHFAQAKSTRMDRRTCHQWTLLMAVVATIQLFTISSGEYLLVKIDGEDITDPDPVVPTPEPGPKPEDKPRSGHTYGVDYNPTDPRITGSTSRSTCNVQNQCASVQDPERRIAAIDEGFTGRGSRYWPYNCCYRYWWNYRYWCNWSGYYCNYFWGKKWNKKKAEEVFQSKKSDFNDFHYWIELIRLSAYHILTFHFDSNLKDR